MSADKVQPKVEPPAERLAAGLSDRSAKAETKANAQDGEMGLVDMTVRHKAGPTAGQALGSADGHKGTADRAATEKLGLPHLEFNKEPNSIATGKDKRTGAGSRSDAAAVPGEAQTLTALNGQFTQILDKMKQEGHHWDASWLPWIQNLSDSRKCYAQAGEMGRAIKDWIDHTPGFKGNFTVQEGTINEGKGEDPRDFYTGNGEHNFIVVTNLKDGSKYYGDPWSGKPFSRDPLKSVHNFKGQKIWEHEFE